MRSANCSAFSLVSTLAREFPSYCDGRSFNGRFVWFLKRAQIFVADVWAAFEGSGFGEFRDIDSITMFADYRVPQQLCALGILKYSERLFNKLVKEDGAVTDDEEAEIRGCSIHAVELLRSRNANAIQIDFLLWDEAKASKLDAWPIHKKRTIFY